MAPPTDGNMAGRVLVVLKETLALAQAEVRDAHSRGVVSVRRLGQAHHRHVEAATDAVLAAAVESFPMAAAADTYACGQVYGSADNRVS